MHISTELATQKKSRPITAFFFGWPSLWLEKGQTRNEGSILLAGEMVVMVEKSGLLA